MLLLPAFTGQPELNKVYHTDALTLLGALADESVDAVITDPPYGMGLDDWDKPIDIRRFVLECYRVLKPCGFLAFTIQMPYMVQWLIEMDKSKFRFKDHISWVKRNLTGVTLELMRGHESILIYSKGSAKYHETRGLYEDIRLPSLLTGVVSIESIDRYIKDLRVKASGGRPNRVSSGSRHHTFDYYRENVNSRSPEYVNFSNVWSFLPENQKSMRGNYYHASVKPVAMFERLCSLLTDKDMLIVDPFVGSGTTAVAAKNTGRNYICGDMMLEYVELARKRVNPVFGDPPKRKREVLPLTDLPLLAVLEAQS